MMRKVQPISASILSQFPAVDEQLVNRLLEQELQADSHKIIVLDDDPTGVQTVHDVSVYTDWSVESIRRGFAEDNRLFYILTNSRSFTEAQTTEVHTEIAANIEAVARECGRQYLIISRSDSTLRGHYPLETELLARAQKAYRNKSVDGEVLCPYFKEGGRFTIDNIHYVKYGEELIPAGQTEFAKDRTFGYQSSDLTDYVEEKTGGAFSAGDVICISLEKLRACAIDEIENSLLSAHDFQKIVVNAADDCDVRIFCIALYRAMRKNKTFLFRGAAALVRAIGGISYQPLLTREQMIVRETSHGGMIVVGSHTQKTTSQLNALRGMEGLEFVEFNSDLVLDPSAFEQEICRVVSLSEQCILKGITVVTYTKRSLLVVENDTKEDALVRSVKISEAVQSLVGRLEVTPAFVIAKGGITSSDVGTKALRVKRANVMGQIRPGIPVWQTGEESKFPMTPYVIFPGNVGEESTLREAVDVLLGNV